MGRTDKSKVTVLLFSMNMNLWTNILISLYSVDITPHSYMCIHTHKDNQKI